MSVVLVQHCRGKLLEEGDSLPFGEECPTFLLKHLICMLLLDASSHELQLYISLINRFFCNCYYLLLFFVYIYNIFMNQACLRQRAPSNFNDSKKLILTLAYR